VALAAACGDAPSSFVSDQDLTVRDGEVIAGSVKEIQ
jgi:hypothetical protein